LSPGDERLHDAAWKENRNFVKFLLLAFIDEHVKVICGND
jgi:hypothetical protein